MAKPETERLLLEIGQEMGKTPEQMRPLITRVVEENWLETKESLTALSADQWRQLGLPLRLEAALKAHLGLTAAAATADENSTNKSISAGNVTPHTAPSGTPRGEASTKEQQQQQQQQQDVSEFAVEQNDVPEGLFVCTIEDALDRFQREVDSACSQEALRVLMQLVLGVLEHPTVAKKRKVRVANPTFNAKVARHAAAIQVLNSVGFAEETLEGEKCLVLRTAYLRRLVICYRLMAEVAAVLGLQTAPLPRGYFDPFACSITSNSGQSTLPKSAAEARAAEAREIERQIKEREYLLATGGGAPSPPLDPQVFTVEEMRQLDRQQRQQQETQQEPWEDPPVSAPAALTAADVMRIREVMGEGPAFQSRAKQQLQQLQKRAVFRQCCVRLLLPDNFVLQLTFAPSDCLSHVQRTAAQFLHEDFRSGRLKWFLCETPPLRRISAGRTLYEEGLAPRCLLHIKLEDDSLPAPPCCLDSAALGRAGVSMPNPQTSSSSNSSNSSNKSSSSRPPPQPPQNSPSFIGNRSNSSSSTGSSSNSISSKGRRTLSRLLGSKGNKK